MPRVRHALRLGLTVGISFFWSNVKTYIPFRDTIEEWPDRLDAILTSHDVTDIVLYGDTRQIHAEAITTVEGIFTALKPMDCRTLPPFIGYCPRCRAFSPLPIRFGVRSVVKILCTLPCVNDIPTDHLRRF